MDETFAGTLSNNTSANISSFNIINEEYPKLLLSGCAPHITNLLPKAIFTRIQELKNIETAVKFCVKFMQHHCIVNKGYQRLCNNP